MGVGRNLTVKWPEERLGRRTNAECCKYQQEFPELDDGTLGHTLFKEMEIYIKATSEIKSEFACMTCRHIGVGANDCL